MAAKAPAKTATQIAAERAEAAKQAAIREINSKVPGLANPEKYVTAKNTANILEARAGYIKENLGLDPARFKAGNYNIEIARNLATQVNNLKKLGLNNAESFIGKNLVFDAGKAEESLIRNVYKDDPAKYVTRTQVSDTNANKVYDPKTRTYVFPTKEVTKYDITTAARRAEESKPTVVAPEKYPENFTQAVNNYSTAFQTAISKGIQNLNDADKANIQKYGRIVRDFAGKNISENQQNIINRINDVDTEIANYDAQRQLVTQQARKILGTPEYNKLTAAEKKASGAKRDAAAQKKLNVDRESLIRLETAAKSLAPRFQESFTRYGLSDVVQGIGGRAADLRDVDTGIAGLQEKSFFDVKKSDFFGRVNSEVTDEQILNDINTQSKAETKRLYDLGTAATTDLQSQITQANQFLSDLPATDPRRAETQKTIDSLTTQLTEAQKDTLEAKNLFDNYQPVSGERATSALSKFRQSLLQPEQRTLKQIKEIDPQLFETIQGLGKQYGELATTPIGPTTAESTEALRRDTEGRIAAQLALGSQLGAEERRQYEQAARGAQTARGNIFGVAPAVEEAVTTGLAGEQRLQARLGAAQGFLSSGQSVSDALSRDVGFRNALQQSRLGAAADFAAGGPTAYNMANARAGQQANMISQYVGAALPQQTGGFAATPSASTPYGYVDPQAGFRGAQNAAQIYGNLLDYASSTYGAQVGAQASSYRSPFQNFASAAGGVSSLFSAAFPKGF